ncbi:hypothetical protein [Oceanobacillus massiliensis]|uniref:hypothetical protein n=1 Tax=Oceanobacillus massiliensis TaxID=1465765 RepID=UPI000288EF71|nr:hypothetical protein [Oceanobacillus massiliensis]
MDEKLQDIIDYTAEKFNLGNYYLKRHHIFREQLNSNETAYVLNMEWFPNEADESNEDYNPPGTASIDIDIDTKMVKEIIFVAGENMTEAAFPPAASTELAIEWIENETGLEFGRQFKLVHEEEKELLFQAAVDNVAVYPSGSIVMKFNEDGKLSLFSVSGSFPNEKQLNWEPFGLTAELIEPIAKSQNKLLEIPLEEEEKWKAVYGTSTVFITNDGKRTISFDEVEAPQSFTHSDSILEWQEPINEPFSKQKIDLSLEVSPEELFSDGTHHDDEILTVNDQQQAETAVRNFLRAEFPEDSGKWRLSGLWREKGYIFAEIKPVSPDARVIDRKIKLIIDEEKYEAIYFVDNQVILEMFKDFETADRPQITEDEAFEKLRPHIEITPVYVYDKKQKRYILCGKIDCEYGVDAVSGEIVVLDEL